MASCSFVIPNDGSLAKQGNVFNCSSGTFDATDTADCDRWVAFFGTRRGKGESALPTRRFSGPKMGKLGRGSSQKGLVAARSSARVVDEPAVNMPRFDPAAVAPASVPLLIRYSERFSSGSKSDFFNDLADALLSDAQDYRGAVAFARTALGVAIGEKDDAQRDRAALTIQRAQYSATHGADSAQDQKFAGWKQFQKNEWKLCTYLRTEREKLLEDVGGEGASPPQLITDFATAAWEAVIEPLVSLAIQEIGKAPGKFCVVAFGLFHLGEWLPHDPVTLGIIAAAGTETDPYYARLLDLLCLKFLSLGEGRPILYNQQFKRRTHSGIVMSNDTTHPGQLLVFSPSTLVEALEISEEVRAPLATSQLLAFQFITGAQPLFKKAQTAVSTLVKSHLLVPMEDDSPPTYLQHAAKTLPNKKKLETFRTPEEVRQRKALSLLKYVVQKWIPKLLLEVDLPYTDLEFGFNIKESLYEPLHAIITAVSLYFDVPLDVNLVERKQALLDAKAFSKKGFTNLRSTMKSLAKLRLLAQLKSGSSSQWMRIGEHGQSHSVWKAHSKHINSAVKAFRCLIPAMLGVADAVAYSRINEKCFDLFQLKFESSWQSIMTLKLMGNLKEALPLLEEIQALPLNSMNAAISLVEHCADTRREIEGGDVNPALVELLVGQQICVEQDREKQTQRMNVNLHRLFSRAETCKETTEALYGQVKEYLKNPDGGLSKRDVICLEMNQAVVLLGQGDTEGATDLMTKALGLVSDPSQQMSSVVKWSHYSAFFRKAYLHHNLGVAATASGDYQSAVDHHSQAAQFAADMFGADSIQHGFHLLNVAHSKKQMGAGGFDELYRGSNNILRVVGCSHRLAEDIFTLISMFKGE